MLSVPQRRKLSHPARKLQSQDFHPGIDIPESLLLTTSPYCLHSTDVHSYLIGNDVKKKNPPGFFPDGPRDGLPPSFICFGEPTGPPSVSLRSTPAPTNGLHSWVVSGQGRGCPRAPASPPGAVREPRGGPASSACSGFPHSPAPPSPPPHLTGQREVEGSETVLGQWRVPGSRQRPQGAPVQTHHSAKSLAQNTGLYKPHHDRQWGWKRPQRPHSCFQRGPQGQGGRNGPKVHFQQVWGWRLAIFLPGVLVLAQR